MAESQSNKPLMVFAALSDIQYADLDNGHNFLKTRVRYYRNSLNFQKRAVENWKKHSPKVEFIIHLGDIIDGFNKRHDGMSQSSLAKVLKTFENFKVYHLIGNHELYNFSRVELNNKSINSAELPECRDFPAPTDQFYYTFKPFSSLRIIAMDDYDLSPMGWPESSSNYQQALEYLKINPNEDKNSPDNLKGLDRRFIKVNGGVGKEQLTWLDNLLSKCEENKENVIVIGHMPIFPAAAEAMCLLWNYQEVLNILYKYTCVIAYLSGHDHEGGYGRDDHSIEHVTFPAILETGPEQQPPLATFSLYQDKLQLKGQGNIPNVDIKLQFPIAESH